MTSELIELSPKDQKLLALLEADARESTTALAKALDVTPAMVRRRMAALEEMGVIDRYTAVVDHWKVGRRLEAYVLLKITIGAPLESLLEEVVSRPGVREAATLAGDEDALVRLRVENPAKLQETVMEIRHLEGVIETKTLVALDRFRDVGGKALRTSPDSSEDKGASGSAKK
ncbi:MAG TPA: Lrp/AsnC family transcriptional regulator [Solirubrobacterales bacterium]|nr:Lrp/AsnC family transcriptional regulator [Solirubrobacterales bacterium]